MRKILIFFALIIFVSSCATPTVVNVIGPNDNKLSCQELSNEIAKLTNMLMKLQKAKKTGEPHNLGAIIFPSWLWYDNEKCRRSH